MDIPLTLEQHFIYDSIAQWGPNLLWNHVVQCMRLSRPLDPAVVRRAVARVIDGDEILRARLKEAGGVPVQHTAPTTADQCLDVVRLTGAGDDGAALLTQTINRPFDLANEPPLRMLVLSGEDQTVVLLVAHHIFVDLRGLGLVMRRLLTACALLSTDALLSRDPGAAPDVPGTATSVTSYLDYALAQRKRIDDGSLAADARAYVTSLECAEPRLNFSGRGPDPRTAATDAVLFETDPGLTTAVMQRSRSAKVSVFSLLSVASLRTMSRLSGQPDLVLAAVADMRKDPFSSVVGQFADMMLIRETNDRLTSGAQSVASVHTQVLGFLRRPVPSVYARDALPWLGRRCRDYGVADVFIDYLGQEPAYGSVQDALRCDVSPVFPSRGQLADAHRFDGSVLAFVVQKAGPRLRVRLQYESALIDERLAHQIAGMWQAELAGLAGPS